MASATRKAPSFDYALANPSHWSEYDAAEAHERAEEIDATATALKTRQTEEANAANAHAAGVVVTAVARETAEGLLADGTKALKIAAATARRATAALQRGGGTGTAGGGTGGGTGRYGDSQLLRVLFGCGRGGKRKLNLGRARALG